MRDPPSYSLRAVTNDMHVFEIDRRGDSVRIWEEIEQRTKSLQAAQTPLHPEPAPKSVNPEDNHDRTSVSTSEPGSHLPRHGDNPSATRDELDDINRPQELRGSRATTCPGRYISTENHFKRQRERHFQASNPPKPSFETGNQGHRPAHHTSMRLSDVLNDDNEAKEVVREKEPIVVAYREGNLTEEGQRQVRILSRLFLVRHKSTYEFEKHLLRPAAANGGW